MSLIFSRINMGGDTKTTSAFAQEQLDSVLGDLFSHLRNLPPEQRVQIATSLLEVGHLQTAFGSGALNKLLGEVKATNTAKKRATTADTIKEDINRIHAMFGDLGLSYLSANYWSPTVSYRQSMVACEPAFFDTPLRKRYAIAFFDVTSRAEQRATDLSIVSRKNYFSLVQYLAKHAQRPLTTLTTFGRTYVDVSTRSSEVAIHIDNDPDTGPPFARALADHVQRLALGAESQGDKKMLDDCLLRGKPSERSSWLERLGEEYEDVFEQAFMETEKSDAQISDLHELTTELRRKFGDNELTAKQVAFLLAMQVLWQRAFQGSHLYAFPTVVNKERSILTAGATVDIQDRDRLSNFGRSLFSNLLFLDYASEQVAGVRRAYDSFVAHNLPKLVFAPATAELEVIGRKLEHNRDLAAADVNEVIHEVDRLKTLFGHYESLMGRLRMFNADPEHPGLPTRAESTNFERDIQRSLELMFEVLQGRVLDPDLRDQVKLAFNGGEHQQFSADREIVIEILVNLISNAVDAIGPGLLADGPQRAIVQVSVARTSAGIQFSVRDHGEGFDLTKLLALRKKIKEFRDADQDRWRTLVDDILDRHDLAMNSLERSGVGLLLSIAYLNQLRWDGEYRNRPGDIIVESATENGSRLDDGTEITINIPDADTAAETKQPEEQIPVDTGTAAAASVCVLTTNEKLFQAWQRKLRHAKWTPDLPSAREHDIVVIDAEFRSDIEPVDFSSLNELDTAQLTELFRDPDQYDKLPLSVRALMAFDYMRRRGGKPNVLVFMCKHPEPQLIWELLRAGADQVCKPNEIGRCSEQMQSLSGSQSRRADVAFSAAAGKQDKKRPTNRVLVVENNRSVCLSLRKRLSDFCRLSFVGAEKPGNKFVVDAEKAFATYASLQERDGVFGAIISDLALDEKSEQYVQERLTQGTRDGIRIVRPTIDAMKKIMHSATEAGDPALPIIFLSDFVLYGSVLGEIRREFGPDTGTYPKNQRGFADLEKHLRRILPQAGQNGG